MVLTLIVLCFLSSAVRGFSGTYNPGAATGAEEAPYLYAHFRIDASNSFSELPALDKI